MSEYFLHSAQEKIKNWSLHGRLGRAIAIGFDYQMWCFGCDIKREEGNLLLNFGFIKECSPVKGGISSRYTLKLENSGALYLWGFAALLHSGYDSLCMKRYERVPRYGKDNSPPETCWRPQDLPQLHAPSNEAEVICAKRLLSQIAQQFLHYEEYVTATTPRSYRKKCLERKPNQDPYFSKGELNPTTLWQALAINE